MCIETDMTMCFVPETRTKRTGVPQASTKASQKQAHPHAPHVQHCYDRRQNENGVPVAGGETEV